MKYNPCPVRGCNRNILPTSRHGVCAHCEHVIAVIDYLVAQERAETEKVAKRKATGIVLPSELRQGRAR